ncbi:MAG: glycosyltransferase [Clostridium sp.]
MITLSCCLIAKNEEKNIKNCLESIKDYADEIIVVDTGSTDNTMEIARSYGAKVIETTWENNFSRARNLSLDNATKDWILILDCDETFEKANGLALKKFIKSNPTIEGLHLHLVNYIQGADMSRSIVFRAFKNRSEYRFTGRMHEQVINSVLTRVGNPGITQVEIVINHYGYDENICSQSYKNKRNLDLLLSYTDQEKDGYYYYALGNEYFRACDFPNAITTYNKCFEVTNYKKTKDIYYSYLALSMAKLYLNLNQFGTAIKYINIFEKDLNNFKDLYFLKGICLLNIGKIGDGLKYFLKAKHCKNIPFEFPNNDFSEKDIDAAISQANFAYIPLCLNSLVYLNRNNLNVLDSIKNLNAISNRVFLVVKSENTIEFSKIIDSAKEMSVEVIITNSENENSVLTLLHNKIKRSHLLILNDDELIPFSIIKLIPELLIGGNNKKNFQATVYNQSTNVAERDIRLIYIGINKENNLDAVKEKLQRDDTAPTPSYIIICNNYYREVV